jgi:DNA-binding NtrC family response regulator
MQRIRVGLYSHDGTLHPLLSSALGQEFAFFVISDQDGANRLLSTENLSLMIVDLNSNHASVQDAIECVRRMTALHLSCLIMADYPLKLTAAQLVQEGAYGYCHRPPSIRDLRMMLRRAHESSVLKNQLLATVPPRQGSSDRDPMIGASPQMQHIHQLVRSVADIDASVLVTGESGTGKELVARAIHSLGSRSSRPFVAVACGAIPEPLLEAELFGHEKGAFTGTAGSREGYFEQAADGTLFLDEIGDLSLYTQVKLLRVFQQREFSRLGSNRLLPLRARLIFATHHDLPELVTQGKFRHDLYYRINVMGIEVPSLQERSEDIPEIASHFLQHYSRLYRKQIDCIEPEAIALLQRYAWPGNVRELENVIQRAIIVTQKNTIATEDLPATLQEEAIAGITDAFPSGSFERQLREFKMKLATTAVREQKGNKTLAARSLSISRPYLHRLIRLGTSPSLSLVKVKIAFIPNVSAKRSPKKWLAEDGSSQHSPGDFSEVTLASAHAPDQHTRFSRMTCS